MNSILNWLRPVIAAILLCMLWSACAPNAHEQKVASIRATLPLIARVKSSVSMHGYQPGDLLLVSASSYADMQPGDHVYIWTPDKEVPSFHLAVRKVFSEMPPHIRWLTHGDANLYNDSVLLTEQTYIGKWTRLTPSSFSQP